MQVADEVFAFTATDVNFALLRDGDDLTLVDGGYPGDLARVEAAVRSLGHRPEDVRAILVTHAHVDHLGGARRWHEVHGTPLLTGRDEVAHVRRDYLEQLSPGRLVSNLTHRGMLGWTSRIVRAGALRDAGVSDVQPAADGVPLDVPGRPVPVATPGHTSGHTAYHLPDAGVVVTGDALVTGHALSRDIGPQLLPAFFNHDESAMLTALDVLGGLDGDCILPGHGRPWHGSLREAADRARATATGRR